MDNSLFVGDSILIVVGCSKWMWTKLPLVFALCIDQLLRYALWDTIYVSVICIKVPTTPLPPKSAYEWKTLISVLVDFMILIEWLITWRSPNRASEFSKMDFFQALDVSSYRASAVQLLKLVNQILDVSFYRVRTKYPRSFRNFANSIRIVWNLTQAFCNALPWCWQEYFYEQGLQQPWRLFQRAVKTKGLLTKGMEPSLKSFAWKYKSFQEIRYFIYEDPQL